MEKNGYNLYMRSRAAYIFMQQLISGGRRLPEEKSQEKIGLRLVLSIAAAGIMSFCGVVIETAMNITFPALMNEFGIGTSTVQWITSGYLLMLAVIMPTSSWLSRRFTLRRLFTVSALTFIAGVVICLTAPNFILLLAGRLLQGIGTGIALPLMYNIVFTQVPENRRGMMTGVASLIPASAPAVGPSVGGLIVETLGWRMIFAVLLPILIAALILGVTCIRNNPVADEDEAEPFDFAGWIILSAGFTCLMIMLGNLGSQSFASPGVAGNLAAFLIFIAAFLRYESNAEKKNGRPPLIHLDIFRSHRFCFALTAFILMQFIVLGIGFIIPNYAQIALGENALVAGCILLPGCIVGAVMAPFAGRTLDRFGAARPLMTGAVCILASTALFMIFGTSSGRVDVLTAIYVLFAFGQSLSVGNGLTNGISALPAERSADGNAVFNTLQQLFGALGTSVCSVIVARRQAEEGLVKGMISGASSGFTLLLILGIVLTCAMAASVRRQR
jgi:DHA2 family lincomycin resistance protein-like MFS transporter